jgi:hypothetical protein
LKESSHKEISIKSYKQIVRKKKVDFMISRREELIFLGKNNAKLFWKELQTKKKQTENNITAYQWFKYAKQLYEQDPKVDPAPLSWSRLLLSSSSCKKLRWVSKSWVLEKKKI